MQPALARATDNAYRFIDFMHERGDAAAEILQGLGGSQKCIPPKYFYDERGAHLFERIAATADYYITRTECEILRNHAGDIAAAVGTGAVLVEPGCGNCEKAALLLPKLRPALYVPIDIAAQALQKYAQRLVYRFPWLNCIAVGADFFGPAWLPKILPEGPRTVFYPGSSIGNFEPPQAIAFLRRLRRLAGSEGGLLIGVDRDNGSAILDRAYNDRDGITALFNLNMLRHVNRLAGADFDCKNFEHRAFYDSARHRVEMHLVSRLRHAVTVAGQVIEFDKGESIHTENSYKYSTEAFSALAAEAGFIRARTWHDHRNLFSLHYFPAGNLI